MAKILWGKPKITISNVEGSGETSKALEVPTPVINSTQLSTERGDKHTADVEGGGNEATRYDRGSHTLEFEIRFAAGRVMPLQDQCKDSTIGGTYKIEVENPEDPTAPKMTIHECTGSYEDLLDAEDGARRHYYFDTQIPSDEGEQITWGNIGTVEA